MIKSRKSKALEQQAIEFSNAIRIVELFLIERGLVEEFRTFVSSVVQEFEKSQEPKS